MRLAALITSSSLLAVGCGSALSGDSGKAHGTTEAVDAGGPPSDAAPSPAPDAAPSALAIVRDFVEAAGNVPNPNRGFYSWNLDDANSNLVLVKPQLGSVCNQLQLPATLVSAIRASLDEVRARAGKKAIVRFVYADDAQLNSCNLADASSMAIVLEHVRQLGPVLAEHRDVIAFVEAGFFGMWGEWNSEMAPAGTSLVADATNRRRLVEAMLASFPAELKILLRRPRFRQELEAAVPAEVLSRVGFHNDCFLASSTDYGTYDGALSVPEWKTYVSGLTSTSAPFGGETCVDEPLYTACPNALSELQKLHATYMHNGYNADVLRRWKDEGCWPEIERRLGYRFVITQVAHTRTLQAGRPLEIEIALSNRGFAPVYGAYTPTIALVNAAGARLELNAHFENGDARRWSAGASATVKASTPLPSTLAPGAYTLTFRLGATGHPESMRDRIQLANAGVWSSATGENRLVTVMAP